MTSKQASADELVYAPRPLSEIAYLDEALKWSAIR
jgi:hypothetical protein